MVEPGDCLWPTKLAVHQKSAKRKLSTWLVVVSAGCLYQSARYLTFPYIITSTKLRHWLRHAIRFCTLLTESNPTNGLWISYFWLSVTALAKWNSKSNNLSISNRPTIARIHTSLISISVHRTRRSFITTYLTIRMALFDPIEPSIVLVYPLPPPSALSRTRVINWATNKLIRIPYRYSLRP